MQIVDAYSMDKYVGFMDLLGFKAKVLQAHNNVKCREEILIALDIVRDSLCKNPNIGMHLTHFSDSIVFSANRTAEGLSEMLESIICLSSNLINYDFMVRGALAVGGLHHDDALVYGTGLIHAYQLENEEPFPRTIVSDDVISDLKKYKLRGEDQIIKLDDGISFVHFLRDYANYKPLPIYSGKLVLDHSGRRIIDFICHRLNTSSQRVLPKVEWFQLYWNSKVAINGVFEMIRSGVLARDSGNHPTRIQRRILRLD